MSHPTLPYLLSLGDSIPARDYACQSRATLLTGLYKPLSCFQTRVALVFTSSSFTMTLFPSPSSSHVWTSGHIASVEGTLKGWDQLLNLVLDDVEELVRGMSLPSSSLPATSDLITLRARTCSSNATDPATMLPVTPNQKRSIGLAVIRGTSLVVINPVDGYVPALLSA